MNIRRLIINEGIANKTDSQNKTKITTQKNIWVGMTNVCITGSLIGLTRFQIINRCNNHKVFVSNSVTRSVQALLVGDDPGITKLNKATKYGIPKYSLEGAIYRNRLELIESGKPEESEDDYEDEA